MRFKVEFQQGWAEGDYLPRIELADRSLPQRVEVHFPSVDGQPELQMRLEVVDGLPQCRELRITSTADGRAVLPRDVKAVDLTAWVEEVFAACASPFERNEDGSTTILVNPSEEATLDAVRVVQAARRGRGARSITRAFLEEAADVYKENFGAKPVQAVAQHFGVSERAASGYITKARRERILNPTTRGKKGI